MRKLWLTIGAIMGSAVLLAAPTIPARAAALPGTLDGNWHWFTNQTRDYCFNTAEASPFPIRTCDETTIGSVSFRIDLTLNGRQVTVTTGFNAPRDGNQVAIDSNVECRKDEIIDQSCGEGDATSNYGYSGTITDVFYLSKNGKYFFNLYYGLSLNGVIETEIDPITITLGTSYRIKCNSTSTSQCSFSGSS